MADSPISAAYAPLAGHRPRGSLLDLAQASPPYPPAAVVRDHVARAARRDDGARYTEVPGLPALRDLVAAEFSRDYGGEIRAEHVVVTAGCNQAFCLVAGALAGPGDEVVVPLPYYFNHDMWLRLNGITPIYLEPEPDLVPSAVAAAVLITERTRAILLVTPGNPTGATVPPARIAEFAELARRHGIALVLDETYRSFRDTQAPPHDRFADPGWAETVVSLYSFSKELALPGYRVGAIVASPALNREVEKLLDCVAVCAPRIGQEAVVAGLTHAKDWRADRAAEIARCRAWFTERMAGRPGGFELLSCGGFFGWVRHPFEDRPTEQVARELATRFDTIVVPGTAFLPEDRCTLRISVSNAGRQDVELLAGRFEAMAAGGGQ